MKVIIAGGRDFNDYTRLQYFCTDVLVGHQGWEENLEFRDTVEIIAGGAIGADHLASEYAKRKSLTFKEFPADWNKYGKGAGPIRNREMAEYSDILIAFWDGKSRGTKNMIDTALKEGLEVHVFKY